MVPILVRDISTISIGKMLLLVQGVGLQWSIPDDNIMESIRQVVPKDIPEPAFDVAHEEHCWIIDSMAGVKQRLGMDHPPFLQAVPTVPPPP
ncbi:unnamed protein product [Lactuca saligna]|uniref:Uncharacterized protein n=1 Tax=Lactuca saligna TaxID=75948 RepID=A0AA35V472_LACSI|nr:unnamed protein product [Lactuca saligna]